jgi:hypothetical protein
VRYIKPLGRLTLGETLGVHLSVHTIILPPQGSGFEVISALIVILVASWRILDDCAHSDDLAPSFVFVCEMAKDGEVPCRLQPWEYQVTQVLGTVREDKGPMR